MYYFITKGYNMKKSNKILLALLALSTSAFANTNLADFNFSEKSVDITPPTALVSFTPGAKYNQKYGHSWTLLPSSTQAYDDGLRIEKFGPASIEFSFENNLESIRSIKLLVTQLSPDVSNPFNTIWNYAAIDIEVNGNKLETHFAPTTKGWLSTDQWSIENYLVRGMNSIRLIVSEDASRTGAWLRRLQVIAEDEVAK